jgi:hypothetical protein
MYISDRQLEIEHSNLIEEVYSYFENKAIKNKFLDLINIHDLSEWGYSDDFLKVIKTKMNRIQNLNTNSVHHISDLFITLRDAEYVPVWKLADELDILPKHIYAFNDDMKSLEIAISHEYAYKTQDEDY